MPASLHAGCSASREARARATADGFAKWKDVLPQRNDDCPESIPVQRAVSQVIEQSASGILAKKIDPHLYRWLGEPPRCRVQGNQCIFSGCAVLVIGGKRAGIQSDVRSWFWVYRLAPAITGLFLG